MTGLPEPRRNPLLRGQGAAEQTLDAAMRSPRMHHAWLLLGPPGIGKATLAFRFARRLLAGPSPDGGLALAPEHPVFRRVAASAHADLLTVERAWDEKKKRLRGEIVVADALRVAEFLRLTPAEGGWRVVVVDGAEDLNRNAMNALLKILEEPPPRAVLLLVCAAAGRLLPTIRSRCRRLVMPPLPTEDVAALLTQAIPGLDAAARARVAGLAEGSIGRAIELAEGEGITVADLVTGVLRAPQRLTAIDAFRTADKLGRDEDAFTNFMDMLRGSVAAAVRAAASGRADPAQARTLGQRPLDQWVAVWQALGDIQGATEGLHLDKRSALVQGFRLLAGAGLPP